MRHSLVTLLFFAFSFFVCVSGNIVTYRHYETTISKDSAFIQNIPVPKYFDFYATFSSQKNPNSKTNVIVGITDKRGIGYKILFNWKEKTYEDFNGNRIMTIYAKDAVTDSIISTTNISDPKIADLYKGFNKLSVFGNKFGGIEIYLNKKLYVAKLKWIPDISKITIESNVNINLKRFKINVTKDLSERLETGYTIEDLIDKTTANRNDSIVGFYRYLDRENDPKSAVIGGKYTIAITPSKYIKDCYDIIYIDGAKTYCDHWHTGMLKGALKKTIFANHFDLEWYDSKQEIINDETSASLNTQNCILELYFPLYKTKVRFSKARINLQDR